jgi:hypothetical protein
MSSVDHTVLTAASVVTMYAVARTTPSGVLWYNFFTSMWGTTIAHTNDVSMATTISDNTPGAMMVAVDMQGTNARYI